MALLALTRKLLIISSSFSSDVLMGTTVFKNIFKTVLLRVYSCSGNNLGDGQNDPTNVSTAMFNGQWLLNQLADIFFKCNIERRAENTVRKMPRT